MTHECTALPTLYQQDDPLWTASGLNKADLVLGYTHMGTPNCSARPITTHKEQEKRSLGEWVAKKILGGKTKVTVKSSHKDISEPHESSSTHSIMPASQVCWVFPPPVINLLFPNERQTYGKRAKAISGKKSLQPWASSIQTAKHAFNFQARSVL